MIAALVAAAVISFSQDYTFGNLEIHTDGAVSVESVLDVYWMYKDLPKEVREVFDYDVYISSKPVEGVYADMTNTPINQVPSIVAFTTTDNGGAIYLEDTKSGRNAFFHEVGHFVEFSGYSDVDSWESLWQYKVNRVSAYASENKSEGYAEAFELYCTDIPYLMKKYPAVYSQIFDDMQSIK